MRKRVKTRKYLILLSILIGITWLGTEKLYSKATGVESAQKALDLKELQVQEMNQQLKDVSAEISRLQNGIREKQDIVEGLENQLSTQQEEEKILYENMKLRIQFLYENGGGSLMEKMLESKSIADFLNTVEYASSITNYDRQMLKRYETVRKQIQENKNNIQKEQELMIENQQQCKNKEQEISDSVKKAQQQIVLSKEELVTLIAKAQEKEKLLEVEIARKQQALWEKIQKEQEKSVAPTNPQSPLPPVEQPGGATFNQSDENLLAALIECEAGGESDEGKIAVGSVVMNRKDSNRFPNSVNAVIYQPGQFAPAMGDSLGLTLLKGATPSCQQAAKEVLGGKRNVNCLFFKRYTGTEVGTVIGNHVFY